MLTIDVRGICAGTDAVYKADVPTEFTLGDVIRKARVARRWSQGKLGEEATKFPLRADDIRINKNTVSKVEREPYSSELGTVWRLIAALGLTFAEIEKRVDPPFVERPTVVAGKRKRG